MGACEQMGRLVFSRVFFGEFFSRDHNHDKNSTLMVAQNQHIRKSPGFFFVRDTVLSTYLDLHLFVADSPSKKEEIVVPSPTITSCQAWNE